MFDRRLLTLTWVFPLLSQYYGFLVANCNTSSSRKSNSKFQKRYRESSSWTFRTIWWRALHKNHSVCLNAIPFRSYAPQRHSLYYRQDLVLLKSRDITSNLLSPLDDIHSFRNFPTFQSCLDPISHLSTIIWDIQCLWTCCSWCLYVWLPCVAIRFIRRNLGSCIKHGAFLEWSNLRMIYCDILFWGYIRRFIP